MTGPVYITLGGKERKLRYDINALTDMEELLHGESILSRLSNPSTASVSLFRLLLWGGLKHAEKGLTLQRVGMMMQEYLNDGGTLESIVEKVSVAVKKSNIFGGGEEEETAENEGKE